MLSDIEIAQQAKLQTIPQIAEGLGIRQEEVIPYGWYKAKLSQTLFDRVKGNPDGRLILVTAINPTPAGEGKTTTSIGLGQALSKLGKRTLIALREPSLGPVFGVKGGAAGGGWAQVVPMEDINLHFTGDMHAITAANNLLSAMLDNHLQQGNTLDIDTRRILWRRCLDMNDRALRNVIVGLGGKLNGIPREEAFQITVASEIMAILCLSEDLSDLKKRLGEILVAYSRTGTPVYAKDLHAEGAMAALLREAIDPNLVQTLENTPALVHGGPFANIAHGCNSVRATKLALKLSDYVVTEAGFGSDLGAEKFLDIKCRAAGIQPSCIVLVATLRALKYNGGVKKDLVGQPNSDAMQAGFVNLLAHIQNMQKYGVPVVVAINKFPTDSGEELALLSELCTKAGAQFALSEVFEKGGEGGVALAEAVLAACEVPSNFRFLYDQNATILEKLTTIATEIYGAKDVQLTPAAAKAVREIEALGRDRLPVCVAKTQYSLSDNPALLGRPTGFSVTIRDVRLSSGAGFIVAYAGDIMTMPGLPKVPAAEGIDILESGQITGLF